tara:strand:+ start:230 stop:442 length:213 start_codon:yes stop_codon:yes gene_type:complete
MPRLRLRLRLGLRASSRVAHRRIQVDLEDDTARPPGRLRGVGGSMRQLLCDGCLVVHVVLSVVEGDGEMA